MVLVIRDVCGNGHGRVSGYWNRGQERSATAVISLVAPVYKKDVFRDVFRECSGRNALRLRQTPHAL